MGPSLNIPILFPRFLITFCSFVPDQDQGSKDATLKDSWVELKENVEETLKNALKIFSKFSWLPSTDKKIAKELGEKHSLATYESLLLADC